MREKGGKVVLMLNFAEGVVFNLGNTQKMPGNTSIKFQLFFYGR